MATKGKILVIRGGAIGDFVLTLPVLAALRRQFPDAHLELLGYPHIAQLALAGGLVDRLQPIEARPLAGFFARDGELAEDWRDYFSEFDIVLSYLYDPDEIFQTNVRRCLHGQFIQGPHRPDDTVPLHAAEVFLQPLEQLAVFGADPVPKLAVTASPTAHPTLALHPGSSSERRNWPEAKWAELLRRLLDETPWQLLLIGGEAEGDRLERLTRSLPADRIELARSWPLAELATRMQSCAAHVGHDTGITHIASALGLPCLVLWAHTVEAVWRPRGERVVIVREIAGIGRISVERVLRELQQLMPPPTPTATRPEKPRDAT